MSHESSNESEVRVNDLDAIRARADAATEGPWQECGHARGGCQCGQVWSVPSDGPVATAFLKDEEAGMWITPEAHKANAAFIAHAREDIPALLARVTALQDALREIATAHFIGGDLVGFGVEDEGDHAYRCLGCVAQAALDGTYKPDGLIGRRAALAGNQHEAPEHEDACAAIKNQGEGIYEVVEDDCDCTAGNRHEAGAVPAEKETR